MSTILPLKQQIALGTLLGKSPQFLKEVRKVPVVAETDVSILITGETGTGKELFARAIHYLSKRSPGPFVPVNCGAIPVELMESELFGHEQGSFTGAVSRKPGLVQEAQGGTLFLDEIDTLTLHAQVKLLRFLQEKECRPVGSTKTEKADVRVISATNIQVDAALRSGRLRTDLYYRLNIMCLAIPPLRQRQEDIRILAGHFLKKYSLEFGKCVEGFSQAAIQALTCYDWPGNVRELENVVERAVVLAEQPVIQAGDVIVDGRDKESNGRLPMRELKSRVVADFEKSYLTGLLIEHHGNVTRAASAAGKNRRAFSHLIQKHGIDLSVLRAESSVESSQELVDVA